MFFKAFSKKKSYLADPVFSFTYCRIKKKVIFLYKTISAIIHTLLTNLLLAKKQQLETRFDNYVY